MRIVPGDYPDVWFDTGDLTPESLILTRRESITCCGFLGGDSIQIIRSGPAFADLLESYRPVLPCQERTKSATTSNDDAGDRREKILNSLRSPGILRDMRPAEVIQKWNELVIQINKTIWFSGSQDPFRYELAVSGDVNSFLSGTFYPPRLVRCLYWWFCNEATPDEQEKMPELSIHKKLAWPSDLDLIIRAVNLYNHGTYEISGTLNQGEDFYGSYRSGKN